MNKGLKNIIVAVTLFLPAAAVSAQQVSSLIINEVMVNNTDGLEDDYGNRSGWIEIFNASYGTVDFGGCYLSDDGENLKKYLIPKGDVSTKLAPRQLALFFACGEAEKGTFYTNFILEEGKTIYLVSNDGKTIIDSVEIPCGLGEKSLSRMPVGSKGDKFETVIAEPTPRTANWDVNAATKSQNIQKRDPHGLIITLISVTVVFAALLVLYICYSLIGKSFRSKSGKPSGKRKAGNAPDMETALAIAMALDKEKGEDTAAAIAMALHDYLNGTVHDRESFIITIRPTFSAWASRQSTVRQLPDRK